MSEIKDLNKKKISELIVIAKELGVESTGKKDEIIKNIIDYHLKNENKKDLTKKDPIKKEIKNKPFERSHNKDARNRYKAPDFEFDGKTSSNGAILKAVNPFCFTNCTLFFIPSKDLSFVLLLKLAYTSTSE